MLERKEIEENWALHEYEKDSSEYSQTTRKVHCKESGSCNVATGGLYLCPAVLLGVREVAKTISSHQKFCVVGSGSLVIEAWILETTELEVVSFDLFVTEHQRRIAERLRVIYDSSRWTQVRGAFENSTERVRCGAIVFDTNIRGHLNQLHWKKIEELLTLENPVMWIQQNNWADFKTYCASSGCAFQHFGTTRTKDGSCYPDMSIVPKNMHPAVLKAGNSWYEQYQFGKWETFHVDESNQHTHTCHEPCSYTLGSVFVRGRRVIRMDDYPFPSTMPIAAQQSKLAAALDILESNDIPYVLGVSPMQLLLKGELDDHVRFLNRHVRRGFVCMHGFDHRTSAGTDDIDTKIWEIGGEFAKYSPRELQDQWVKGDAILRRIDRYTTDHFIPPFNALTQDMVTTLARNGVKYIHSFDVALRQRPKGAVSHPNVGGNFGGWIEDYQLPKGVLFVVAEWGKSYADVDDVSAYLSNNPRGSQATLHWYYDSRKKNYAQLYEDFSAVVTGEG